MSKYKRIQAEFKDEAVLRQALEACGVPFEQGQSLPMYGYHGDRRPETAEYVIRRAHIESSANDLGFHRLADGSIEVIISEYDSGSESRPATQVLNRVKQQYAYHAVVKRAAAQGYHIVKQPTTDGTLRVQLVRG